MDLKKEYHENPRINGKPSALSYVENEIDPVTGETVITRTYCTGDGTKAKVIERIPPAVRPVAPVAAAAPEKPKAPKYPCKVPAKTKIASLKGRSLEPGMVVVYETKDGLEAGVIVKVMLRTVCIDIDGTKDKSVKKSELLGTIAGS